ncbi:MAG: hypothetical protein ABW088_15310 [Sedimenticola sp.]
MSESSEDRTKRKYINYLHSCEWKYQYSIFYKSIAASKEAVNHAHKLKRNFSRTFKNPLLHRLQLRGGLDPKIFDDGVPGKRVIAAYHSFFSTDKLDREKLEDIAGRVVDGQIKVNYRSLRPEKLARIESAIKNQKPHDLITFFGKSNIQRISLLNKKYIP